jgi:hypothetical protein
MRAVELQKWGLYHLAGRDIVSRYDFAVRLAGVFGLDSALITPIKTEELRQPAPIPLQSGLVTLKAETEIGYRPSTVEEGLMIVRSQLFRNSRRSVGDRAPASAQSQRLSEGRSGKCHRSHATMLDLKFIREQPDVRAGIPAGKTWPRRRRAR